MIYTIGGIKGGSGKTTVATNLAIFLSLLGRNILLIDADDQESATDFTSTRNELTGNKAGYTAVKLSESAVRVQTLNLAEQYDDIVIDTGGRDTVSQRAAMSASDIYLVPFAPGGYDIWTIDKVEALIREIMTINPDLQSYVFVNRADHEGSYNDDAAETLGESEHFTFLNASLGNRKVFRHSCLEGKGVMEYRPTDAKAVAELEALFSYLTKNTKVTI